MSNKELVYTKSSTEKLRKFLNYMPKLKLEDNQVSCKILAPCY